MYYIAKGMVKGGRAADELHGVGDWGAGQDQLPAEELEALFYQYGAMLTHQPQLTQHA